MGSGSRRTRLGVAALDDGAVESLRASVAHVAGDEVETVACESIADTDVDCLLFGWPNTSAERIESVASDPSSPPLVAVHVGRLDDEASAALLDAGVVDVVSRSALDDRGDVLARRFVTLASAHAETAVDSGAGTDSRDRSAAGRSEESQATPADHLQREREFLYAFHDVTMDPYATFDEQASALLELCCDALGFDAGVLSRVSGDDYEIRAAHAPGEHITAGDTLDLDDTFCRRAVESASVEWFLDANEGSADHPAFQRVGKQSALSIPVRVGDGLYGTLCLVSESEREEAFDDAEIALARLVSEWVGSELLRTRRQRELEAMTDRLASLVDATPLAVVALDGERTVTEWNTGAEEMFGWTAEEIVGEEYPLVPEGNHSESEALLERSLAGERLRGVEICRERKDGDLLDLRLSTAAVHDADGEPKEVYAIMDEVTDRRRFERKLRALQTTTSRLNLAADTETIRQLTVDAATEVLGHPLTVLWEYDDDRNRLVPTVRSDAATARFEALPSFGPDDGRLWDVFEAGAHVVYDDLSAIDDRYEGVRSGVAVAVGDHGILGAGTAAAASEYDERDRELVQILAAAAEAALTRADRERRLRETNERLDQFASLLAHDLRSPLTTAAGFLDLARETGAADHFEKVESAHDRMASLIDDLLTLARTTDRTLDRSVVSLDTVVEEAWSYVETDDVTLRADALGSIACDPGQLGRVFENLFRNALEHGDADTVVVDRLDDGGFAVADDGSGFDGPVPDDLFEHGHASSNGGIGFGLSIVDDIVTAHGWTVEVTTADHGGARFEVRPA